MSNSPIVDRTASATAAFTGRIGGLMSAFGPITEVATLAISDAAARPLGRREPCDLADLDQPLVRATRKLVEERLRTLAGSHPIPLGDNHRDH